MKEYKDYNLEDFLLDDSFRNWVLKTDAHHDTLWTEIQRLHPDKRAIMDQARGHILTLRKQHSSLTDQEVEQQIARILHSTEPEVQFSETSWSFQRYWWRAAASILVVLGIGWVYFHQQKTHQQSDTYKEYISAVKGPLKEALNSTDQKIDVLLPDSSVVTLTPSSKISYSQAFVKNSKREVYLSGEAFFNVKKDTQNPFYVYANGLLTRVLGTSFLVKTTGENVEVVVRTGRVSVVPMTDIDSQNNRNTELLLTPNQQAIFTLKDNLISKSIIGAPVALEKAELEPDFNFENQPVSSVFTVLEKVYGIHFIYDTAIMKDCYLRVKLNDEAFFTKLDIICQTIGANYRVSDGQVIITSEGCEQ